MRSVSTQTGGTTRRHWKLDGMDGASGSSRNPFSCLRRRSCAPTSLTISSTLPIRALNTILRNRYYRNREEKDAAEKRIRGPAVAHVVEAPGPALETVRPPY